MKAKKVSDLKSFDGTLKILIINESDLDLNHLKETFGHRCNMVLTYYDKLIEITASDVSKAQALKWITERLELSMDEVIAFGDDNNDHAIIEAAGWGVAMGNANDTIKLLANEITLSNDEDGVAVVIERIMECFDE